MSDVDTLRDRLIAERENADPTAAVEILAAVARVEHYNRKYGEGSGTVADLTCPADRITQPADLAAWLPECPADVTATAVDLANDAWSVLRGHGMPGTNGAIRFGLLGFQIPMVMVMKTAHRQQKREIGAGDPDLLIGAFHLLWLDARQHNGSLRHPLAPIVEAWQLLAPVTAEWDTRPHSVLPGTLAGSGGGLRPLVVANDPRQLPLMLTGGTGEPPRQLWLGFKQPEPEHVPVLPLVAFDRRGGVSMTRGAGAAHAIRLYVEALLAVPPDLRRVGYGPPAALRCKLRDVVAGLWPRGWNRGRDWPRLLAGLDELRRLGVEWEHNGTGGVWFAVTVRSVPRDAQLDDLVQFEVLLPPGSGPGPMVAREHLRLLGLDSAPAYRLYLSLCWLWDYYGTVGGRLIGTDVPQRRDRKQPLVQPVKVDGRLVTPGGAGALPGAVA